MDVEARLVTPNVEDSIWVWTIDLYTDTAAAADDDDYDDDDDDDYDDDDYDLGLTSNSG